VQIGLHPAGDPAEHVVGIGHTGTGRGRGAHLPGRIIAGTARARIGVDEPVLPAERIIAVGYGIAEFCMTSLELRENTANRVRVRFDRIENR